MFNKSSGHNLQLGRCPIEALNRPEGWEIFDNVGELSISRVKLASADAAEEDLNGFDLTAAVKEHPDKLFVKIFAIKRDEVNDNGDAFSESELRKAVQTFIGKPVFCNHANDDIEKARGKIVHSWYDENLGGIQIISMVDKVAYPKLARGIEEGYINGTSMGCQVHHSCCSICHNKAHTADEYCEHVKHRKTKKFSGKVKCAYHKSKCKPGKNDLCEVCNKLADEAETKDYKEAQIHEWNYGLNFIEDSFVVNPACHDCLVQCVLNVPEMSKAAQSLLSSPSLKMVGNDSGLRKVASVEEQTTLHGQISHIIGMAQKIANSPYFTQTIKFAGTIEIQNLNQAMKLMEVVTKSMMDQKEQVSMEYVSDIVDVLASLQTVTDELVEMGYANIQSPPTLQDPNSVGDAVPIGGQGQQNAQTSPNAMQPNASPQPPAGQVGSVTTPTLAGNLKESIKTGGNAEKRISSPVDTQLNEERSVGIKAAALTSEINQVKETDNKMSNENKTAAGQGQKTDIAYQTTEKQFENTNLEFHARTDKAPEGITESDKQLGGSEQYKDVSSDSPQVRTDEQPRVTTDGQLDDFTGTPIARWNKYPDTILEKNWTEFSRAVGSVLSKDQADHTTQSQLEDLRSHHRWTEPKVTTENQLGDDVNWLTKDNAWLDKAASVAYSKALVKAAVAVLTDAIADYNITPVEIVKAAKFISRDPQSQIKAAFITLINGMPGKPALRKAEVARAKYFGKVPADVTAVDAVLACAGDHCLNLKAEDLIDAIRHIAVDSKKLASVETKAKAKLAETVQVEDVVDKFAAFDSAFDLIEKHDELSAGKKCEDCGEVKCVCEEEKEAGIHVVPLKLADIGAEQSDTAAFIAATEKLAKNKYPGVDAILYAIDIDDKAGVVEATLKETNLLTASEIVALETLKSAARKEVKKEAQMMGGGLGGGMDGGGGAGAGGAGATMPAPPAAGAPPAQPPIESMDGGGEGEEGGMDDAEAKPPGSICPVCGSEDVDIISGKGRCNNCTAEFIFKVDVEVMKWPGVNDNNTDDGSPEGGEDIGIGADDGTGQNEGEGFAMPEGGEGGNANIPVAAMTKFNPEMLKKLAAANPSFKIGSVSPLTGTSNTYQINKNEWLCLDTGRSYQVHEAISKKNVNDVYFEWRWTPKTASEECTSCQRAKNVWAKALKTIGLSDEKFEEMSYRQKADTVLSMHSKGLFNSIKTASKNSSIVEEFKKVYAAKAFPLDECRAKIAKRFGENAVALSGPNKGQKLADCVCNQLKNAGVYSDSVAIKVADTWKDKDACIECMEDHVRLGYEMEKAATICQSLKLKYAGSIELFAEDITDMAPMGHDDGGFPPKKESTPGDDIATDMDDPFGDNSGGADDSMTDDTVVDVGNGNPADDLSVDLGDSPEGGLDIDIDPAAGATGDVVPGLPGDDSKPHGTVSIEIPLSALDAIEKAIDSAHGEDPDAEPHHDIPQDQMGDNVEVELPGGEADALENAIEPVLDEQVGEGGESNDSGEDDLGGDDEGMGFGGDNEPDNGPSDGTPPPAEDQQFKEGDEMDKDKLASYMRKGKIGGYGEINLDIASIAKALNKKAGEVEPKIEGAQDVVDGYSAGDGSVQGQEEKFDADKPKVPRNQATLDGEDADLNPQDKPLPKVPKANGKEGNLDGEENYEAESGVNMSGGAKGQGKTETAGGKNTTKQADKLSKPKAVENFVNIPRSHKDLESTPDKMKREPCSEKEYPEKVEKGEGARIKGEVDNGSVPKADKAEYTPDIPVGGAKAALDKEEKSSKEFAPQDQTERSKGTVSASGGNKSRAIEAEATRIACRMIEEKMIGHAELMAKIAELKQYEMPTLKQIEKTLFTKKLAQKGLAAEPDGVELTVPIASEVNTAQPRRQDELKSSLQALFTLNKRNKQASELTDEDFRKTNGR